MLRVAGQAFAAVTGGADLLTTAAWDRPLGVSTDDARRLSRNTQSILGEESALGRVLDPAGGSHYVERLTDDLGRLGWRMMQEIEAAGGAAATMSSGWLGRRPDGSRAARQAELADGRRAIIGVTHYADDDERLPERDLPTPEAAAERAIDRLREHRTARPEAPDPESDGSGQSLDVWVEMARQGATLGEISVALGRTCCETTPPLPLSRDSEGLE
jgi:methylmalonyl-CoA mutase